MLITLRYFAGAREAAGVEHEHIQVPDGADVAAVRALVAGSVAGLAPLLPRCAVAVNRAYASERTPLYDGDELALLPPLVADEFHRGVRRGHRGQRGRFITRRINHAVCVPRRVESHAGYGR